jgi:isocitrate lyase
MTTEHEIKRIQADWSTNARWKGVKRGYEPEDVVRLRGTVKVEHSLARHGAEKLWRYMGTEPFVNSLGALTGNQAMQQVKAGLKAIYLSGWQVAADANLAGQMYPDQSLYPADSVPNVVRRINNALLRADQLHHAEGDDSVDWIQPIVADADAGVGGVLNAHELMRAMIEAGAAGGHFTLKISWLRRRNAATWAARCWSLPAKPCKSSLRPAWRRISWMFQPFCWRAPMQMRPA